MGQNDHIEDDDGYVDFLEQVISMGHLEGPALGITKQVIDKGDDSLSGPQAYVFKRDVIEPFTVSECVRCGSPVPWSEMYDAATEHKMCGWCWHMINKDD